MKMCLFQWCFYVLYNGLVTSNYNSICNSVLISIKENASVCHVSLIETLKFVTEKSMTGYSSNNQLCPLKDVDHPQHNPIISSLGCFNPTRTYTLNIISPSSCGTSPASINFVPWSPLHYTSCPLFICHSCKLACPIPFKNCDSFYCVLYSVFCRMIWFGTGFLLSLFCYSLFMYCFLRKHAIFSSVC